MDHCGPLQADPIDRKYKVHCKRCGNKGKGIIEL